jgi:hypothetical protein
MEQAKRGTRRARGSVTRNRVGNWQVRYTDPHGVRRAAGTPWKSVEESPDADFSQWQDRLVRFEATARNLTIGMS